MTLARQKEEAKEMNEETAVRLVEVIQRKANELCNALIAELRDIGTRTEPIEPDGFSSENRDEAKRPHGYEAAWSLDNVKLADGDWLEIRRTDGETYTWPDKSVDTYRLFVTYVGTGGRAGTTLGLGYKNDGVVVGFVLGADGGSRRGITVFFPADDFGDSEERASMIRGGGGRGRAGFGRGDALPSAYTGFKVEMLRDRVAGKWNVQAIIAKADDYSTMLDHTALQARLRRLTPGDRS